MTAPSSPTNYAPSLVTALQRMQAEAGYLRAEDLKAYSKQSGIPLQRLQAVASFFPHFKLTPPLPVTVKVCRDMSCQMAGSRKIIEELKEAFGDHVQIEGVSCLGRCDRSPACSVSLAGEEHDRYCLGRTTAEVRSFVEACMGDAKPEGDHDAAGCGLPAGSVIDLYKGRTSDFAAVRKALAARDRSIRAAVEYLSDTLGFELRQVEEFHRGAMGAPRTGFSADPTVINAVRAWRTDTGWASEKQLGGWSEEVLREIEEAELAGMGGAGIPSAQKLRDVRNAVRTARKRDADDRAFIVVNGDESEPGTFKDRELLLKTPHLIVEAVILAGLVTEATQGFIYIRHEYQEQIEACREAIARAEELGFCGSSASMLGRPFPVCVFVSPGGYICGEQSALIEAMSDHRGEPRNLPPKLETNGLMDLPTIVSNVETYAWMPYIAVNSGKIYAALGVNGWKGRRLFSVSGDVKRPGVYEVPIGMTLRDLVYGETYCQGIQGNKPMKAFAPSGPSGGFLPAKLRAGAGLPRKHVENKSWIELAARRGIDPAAPEIDILDLELSLALFRALSPTQALGAGLVVYAEGRDMAQEAVASLEFFRNESCGKCVPCRLGSQRLASLGAQLLAGSLSAAHWRDEILPALGDLSSAIELASICGLGRSVPLPLRTAIAFFPEDINRHLGA